MSEEADKQEPTGRAAVRSYLIEPLKLLGLVRPAGVTLEVHAAQLEKLQDRLAYLGRNELEILCDAIEANAEGDAGDRWPAIVTIIKWAADMKAPPDEEHRLVVSWLQSVEGPKALEGGYAVELRGWLRRNKRPPNAFVLNEIKQRAEDHQRQCIRFASERDNGTATDEQKAWLEAYERAQRECADLINAPKEGEAA